MRAALAAGDATRKRTAGSAEMNEEQPQENLAATTSVVATHPGGFFAKLPSDITLLAFACVSSDAFELLAHALNLRLVCRIFHRIVTQLPVGWRPRSSQWMRDSMVRDRVNRSLRQCLHLFPRLAALDVSDVLSLEANNQILPHLRALSISLYQQEEHSAQLFDCLRPTLQNLDHLALGIYTDAVSTGSNDACCKLVYLATKLTSLTLNGNFLPHITSFISACSLERLLLLKGEYSEEAGCHISVADLARLTNLKSLSMGCVLFDNLDSLTSLTCLTSLKLFDVADWERDAIVERLHLLPNLIDLTIAVIWSPGLSSSQWDYIVQLTNLRGLSIHGTPPTSAAGKAFVERLTHFTLVEV